MPSPVVVVGAGPVGLSAALALPAHGFAVTVFEAEPKERIRPGSRAIYVHGTTLRLLERMLPSLGARLAAEGLVWPTRRTFWRGREVFRRTYAGGARNGLPHFTSLPQVEAERILLEACEGAGVEISWGTSVVSVDSCPDGVTVVTDGAPARNADFVVGADGARSAVRRSIGATLEGSRSVNWYVIVDVAEDPEDPLPVERVFHYEHPAVGGRNVLLVPFAGGWRADLQCNEDDDPESFRRPDAVRAWVAATLGRKYGERITWVSTYQFLQVVADTFVDHHRRVLLAGEAAHLFAPFGARGMNSGIADADAAAEAIAAAAGDRDRARAPIAAFDRRRRAAAEWNRTAAGLALQHLQARTPWESAKRAAAALAAPWIGRAAEWLDTAPYGPTSGPRPEAGSKY